MEENVKHPTLKMNLYLISKFRLQYLMHIDINVVTFPVDIILIEILLNKNYLNLINMFIFVYLLFREVHTE